jgi:hypothetical protein
MPRSAIESLDPEIWFARAASLLAKFDAEARGSELEAALRRCFHLVQLTPLPLRDFVRSGLDENAFEQLLTCGAFESAAFALADEPAGLRLERSEGSGLFRAVVWLHDEERAGVTESGLAANAVLGAWLHCINALWPAPFGPLSHQNRSADHQH